MIPGFWLVLLNTVIYGMHRHLLGPSQPMEKGLTKVRQWRTVAHFTFQVCSLKHSSQGQQTWSVFATFRILVISRSDAWLPEFEGDPILQAPRLWSSLNGTCGTALALGQELGADPVTSLTCCVGSLWLGHAETPSISIHHVPPCAIHGPGT